MTWSAHLPDTQNPCDVYEHVPPPTSREPEQVIADAMTWATAAGLTASPEGLRRTVTYIDQHPDDGGPYLMAQEQIVALVLALGFEQIGLNQVDAEEPYGLWAKLRRNDIQAIAYGDYGAPGAGPHG